MTVKKRSHSISLELSAWPSAVTNVKSNINARTTTKITQIRDETRSNFMKSNKPTNEPIKIATQAQKELSTSTAAKLSHSEGTSKVDLETMSQKELLEKELSTRYMYYSRPFSETHPFVQNCSNKYSTTPQVILDHIKWLREGHCIQSMICLKGSPLTVPQLLDFRAHLEEAVQVEKKKQRCTYKLGTKVGDHMKTSYTSVNTQLDFAGMLSSF